MIRNLIVHTGKHVPYVKAAAALKRGMAVTYNPTAGTVAAATGADGIAFVDAIPNFDGINAVAIPNDTEFENIASGAQALLVIPTKGERYAVNQITAAGLVAGDKLEAAAGLLVKSTALTAQFVYVGVCGDPDFKDMHEICVL